MWRKRKVLPVEDLSGSSDLSETSIDGTRQNQDTDSPERTLCGITLNQNKKKLVTPHYCELDGTVPTTKGREKKVYEGHFYTFHSQAKNIYWRCDRWKSDQCPGQIVENTEGSIKVTQGHNHGANYGREDVLKFVHSAKKQVIENVPVRNIMID